ncbi:MAG: glycosyltransferase family A protein [Actinomycetota bacterium]
MTTISVVIPSLNDASMLKVCLDALAVQTRLPDEIVVVDNGSTDDTAAVAAAAGARVITQPVRGIYPATSAGYDAATGDVIARLDADSIPAPDWVERIEYGMSQVEPLTAISGAADFYGSNALVHWLGKHLYIGGMYWSMDLLLGHPIVFGSNFAMPAEIWVRLRGKVNRTVTNIHDDLDLSYHFEPDMGIVYDQQLKVRISARPFRSPATLGRRIGWVYTTLSLDFKTQGPFARRRARRDWEAAQAIDAGDEPSGVAA